MKLNNYPKVLLICVLLTLPALSYGQFEIGYSYVMATGQYKGGVPLLDNGGNYIKDTSVSKAIAAKVGFGFTVGSVIPVKRLGRNTSLALSIEFLYNLFIWGDLNPSYSTSGSYNEPTSASSLSGGTVQLALPIGLDFKYGTDATRHRTRFGYAIGAGAMPMMTGTVLTGFGADDVTGGGGFNLGVNPYVKGEVSLYAGICFKLRAILAFGDVPYIDQTKSTAAFSNEGFSLTGKTNLTVSFVVLPLAFRWGKLKHQWYDDYDTRHTYK